MRSRRLTGRGLHGGLPCSVTIEEAAGPTSLGRGDDRASLDELVVVGRARCSVAVLPSGLQIATVEHLLSAIVGAAVFEGARIDVDGDELPLLDGGSATFFDALESFPSGTGREAVVTRGDRFSCDDTELFVEIDSTTDVSVEVDYPASRYGAPLRGAAHWAGDRDSYRASIATARTFGAAAELSSLRREGLAAHVPPGAVVALDVNDPAYAPSDPDEPIRHKLLDALGDLATLGARLRGRVRIVRPSHRGTRGALARALAAGAITRG